MALGTTSLTTTQIRNALGEDNNSVFTLASSDLINRWSRKKPVRSPGLGADWPISTSVWGNGRYGLAFGQGESIDAFNLTEWTHNAPRGGSPGGSPDEPGRMGDFREYQHTQAAAGTRPVVGITSANAPSGTYYNSIGDVITFSASTCSDSTYGITPDDMLLYAATPTVTMGDYYLAIYLTDGVEEKWLSAATDINAGGSISITLSDLPYSGWSGSITWEACIVNIANIDEDSIAGDDVNDALYVSLPTGLYAGFTYLNTGTFTLDSDITNALETQVTVHTVADETTLVTATVQLRSKIGRTINIPSGNTNIRLSPIWSLTTWAIIPDEVKNHPVTGALAVLVTWTTIFTGTDFNHHFNEGGFWGGGNELFDALLNLYVYGSLVPIGDTDVGVVLTE